MSLYSTGFYIKKFVVLFFIFIGLLVSIGIIGTVTKNLTRNLQNVTPEAASRGFGNIIPAKIPQSSQANVFKPSNFIVDTLTGTLPDFTSSFQKDSSDPGLVNVYKIDIPNIDASARSKGYSLATLLGFQSDPIQTNNNLTLTWSNNNKRFIYNVDNQTFNLITTDPSIISTDISTAATQPTSLDSASNIFKNLFSSTNSNLTLNDPLSYFKTDYVKFNGSSWDLSTGNVPSNYIRVSYMRYSSTRGNSPLPSAIDPNNPDSHIVKEYYPFYYYSPMYMIMKNTANFKPTDIVELSFNQFNYDVTRPQTYTPKTINEAFNDLKNNQATLVNITTDDFQPIDSQDLSPITDAHIKEAYLGYYVGNNNTGYVLPIYVFKAEFVLSTIGTIQKKGEAYYYDYAFK